MKYATRHFIIANQLKVRRAELDLKRSEVAARAGLSESELKRFENGEDEPDEPTLSRLAVALNVSPEYLLDEEIALPIPKEME